MAKGSMTWQGSIRRIPAGFGMIGADRAEMKSLSGASIYLPAGEESSPGMAEIEKASPCQNKTKMSICFP